MKYKVAYLAGLIDGEGYVKVEKWGTIRITIGMTSRKVIHWLKREFGGKANFNNKTTTGKSMCRWTLNKSLDCMKLMILVYLFLVVKKHRVLDALSLLFARLKKSPDFHSSRGLEF